LLECLQAHMFWQPVICHVSCYGKLP